MVRPGIISRRQIHIASIGGIPVHADYRWFPVAVLFTFAAALALRPMVEDWIEATLLGFGVTTGFFLSVLVHEFAHAIAARRESLSVVEVVLHPFGGFSRFRHPPQSPEAEFRIALAGPMASFVLFAIFAVAGWLALSAHLEVLAFFLIVTSVGNLLLGFFNLLPGYPLDGGRLVRAYLWRQGRSLRESTTLTGKSGQIIGAAIIFAGIFTGIFGGQWLAAAWFVVIGVFLFDSARTIVNELSKEEQIPVSDLMHLPKLLGPEITVQQLADNVLPMYRELAFPVVGNGNFLGLLLLSDVRRVDPSLWRTTPVKSILRPPSKEMVVYQDSSVADARELMREAAFPALAVIDSGGVVIGILDESHLPPPPRG